MAAPPDPSSAVSPVQNLSLNSQPNQQSNGRPQLSFYDETYPARALPVTGGERVQALANFFDIDISRLPDEVFTYSFSFPQINNRDIKNNGVKKELIRLVLQDQFFAAHATSLATDWNALLVSLVDLAADPNSGFVQGASKDVTVQWTNQARPDQPLSLTIVVQKKIAFPKASILKCVKPQGMHDRFDCASWLQVLNILARRRATQGPDALTIKIGREKFFFAVVRRASIREIRRFVSSIRPVGGTLAMNLQRVATAFITEQPLLDFVKASEPIFGPQAWRNAHSIAPYEASFRAITKGLQVRSMYHPPGSTTAPRSALLRNPLNANPVGRLFRVNGFGRPANVADFVHSSTAIGKVTVEDYFNRHVMSNYRLQYPSLPCINTGSQSNPVLIPPELLYIEPHQPKRGVLGEGEMRSMLPVAQQSPRENVRDIEAVVATNGIFERAFLSAECALDMTSQHMKQVSARMLPIPNLQYRVGMTEAGGPAASNLRNGAWTLQKKKFRVAGQLDSLGVIHFDEQAARGAYQSLTNALTTYGILPGAGRRIHTQSTPSTGANDLNHALGLLRRADQDNKITAILVMLGDRMSPNEYAEIKHCADTRAGLPSICVAKSNHAKLFNIKLGGKNHMLNNNGSIPNGTMIVGADVTHPGLGSVSHCPSAAAVVASNDPSAVVYPGSLRLQKGKDEMIADLADMMAERLQEWKNKNKNTLPTRILFYRDGVSEGQFAYVKRDELPRIMEDCRKVDPAYQPPVTLVVCGKRHHTRFYPDTHRPARPWARDDNGNFRPGLLVDDLGVRSPFHFDFSLPSHRALKGTARPCHYFVIHNPANLTPALLQQITFDLCFTFATALTPISYASPAYYADRFCDRARCYLRPLMQLNHRARPSEAAIHAHMSTLPGSTWHSATDEQKDVAFAAEVSRGWRGFWPTGGVNPAHDALKDTMFYTPKNQSRSRPAPIAIHAPSPLRRSSPHARPFSSTSRRSYKTVQEAKTRYKLGPFSWQAGLLFLLAGAGLTLYFRFEKARMARARIAEANKGIGKPLVGGPFTLTDHHGHRVTQDLLKGKYSLVYFGFTHCPDICPEELDKMAGMIDRVKERHGDVLRPVFISCDPARDTPEVLRRYLAEFHGDILGLVGSWQEVKDVCKAYRVYFSTPPDVKPGQDYLVDHSIYFYLMDPEGDFVEAIGRNFGVEAAAKVIGDHVADWRGKIDRS
ncbi:Protein SCO1, mitochondrial [Teratosphaeria destructans]|uniref:Protein SCO1, mitochondrial n=1 Tax=Teratosphaeria destructans TaxID=418781 RepID=A0A9W7W3D1_9PEZI|nr:Protein SCO1, mitochondrial [Teratosphaeria destructans]